MKKLFVFVFFLFFGINAAEEKELCQFDTWVSVQGPIGGVTLFVDGYNNNDERVGQFPINLKCSEITPESKPWVEDLMHIEFEEKSLKKFILTSCLIEITDPFKSQVPQPKPAECRFELNKKQGARISTLSCLAKISVKDGKPDKTKNVFDLLCVVTPFKIESEDSNE